MDNVDHFQDGSNDSLGDLQDMLNASEASWLAPTTPQSPPNFSHTSLPIVGGPSTSRSPQSPDLRGSSIPRPQPQRRTASTSRVPALSITDQTVVPHSFEPPLRSRFASGPPTSSVSVNTALASMSTATSSPTSRPLAALSTAGGTRRAHIRGVDIPPSSPIPGPSDRTMLNTEKDVDDPSASVVVSSLGSAPAQTSTSISRLFAPSDATTPNPLSRGPSHFRSLSAAGRTFNDASTLTGHLLHNGFMDGKHSDITIHAFGQSYKLHKLLLDRIPFFSSAFSGAWAESSAQEMNLLPEDIDINISKAGFELAMKRVYGSILPEHEEQETIGLFATACWLNMPDLVDSCVDSILRQMHPSRLHTLIKLVTSNYYGKAGDRVLSSAKAMLCREGWEMPYEYWDHIPAEIVREIIGGDPFYVPGEWERWFLSLKLLNRRLRKKAIEAGLVSASGLYLHPKPSSLRFFAVRFDTIYRHDSGFTGSRMTSEKDDAWVTLYTSPDIAPLLVLLDEGIHYVHLRFEQLQQIRTQKDILGVPVLPEKVISDALWMSMELRQRVLNATESDLELGISEVAEDYDEQETELPQITMSDKGKARDGAQESTSETEIESGSWDGNAMPRKFWIPTNDVSCIMGGSREAFVAANSTSTSEWSTHAARLSASLDPTDVAWAVDFTGSLIEGGRPPSRNTPTPAAPRFSFYPPFRFSAEFPNPRTLKEKKRVYSQTVWYAGSMWNLYIQRVNTSKNQQLGIYLHRAKDKDPSDDPLAQFIPATVDDRIGQLEREMLLRKSERRNQQWRAEVLTSGGEADREDESSASAAEDEDTNPIRPMGIRSRTGDASRALKTSQTPVQNNTSRLSFSARTPSTSVLQLLDSDDETEELVKANRRLNVSAMPPYIDSRPTIKTYFKIYSPSKGGRLLSIYESAPDRFNFSQSWGWKSSQMVLDDGLGVSSATFDLGSLKSSREGKLRYMVVIGIV